MTVSQLSQRQNPGGVATAPFPGEGRTKLGRQHRVATDTALAPCPSPALKAVAMAWSIRAVALELHPELWEPTIRYAVQPLRKWL